jgi:hypothetical protein
LNAKKALKYGLADELYIWTLEELKWDILNHDWYKSFHSIISA